MTQRIARMTNRIPERSGRSVDSVPISEIAFIGTRCPTIMVQLKVVSELLFHAYRDPVRHDTGESFVVNPLSVPLTLLHPEHHEASK